MKNEFLEIQLKADKAIIVESLERMGIANKEKKILYPSCYIYEKDGKIYLLHFKQMFSLLRKDSYDNITEGDLRRRNSIAFCLQKWGLINIDEKDIEPYNVFVYVLSHKDKKEWQIFHKFNRNLV